MNFISLFKEITGEDFGGISCEELTRLEPTCLPLHMNSVGGDSLSIFQKCLDVCNRSPEDFSEIRSCLNKPKMDLLLSCILAAAFPSELNQSPSEQTLVGLHQDKNTQVQTKSTKQQTTTICTGFNSDSLTSLSKQNTFRSTATVIRDQSKNDALESTSIYKIQTTVDNSDMIKCVGKNSVTNLNRDMYNPSNIPSSINDTNNVNIKNKNIDSLNQTSELFEERNSNLMSTDVSGIHDGSDDRNGDRIIVWKRPLDRAQNNSPDDNDANQNSCSMNLHANAKSATKNLGTYTEQQTVGQQPRIDDTFIFDANISTMIPNYNDRRLLNVSEDYFKEIFYPTLQKFIELVCYGNILIQFYATLEAEKIIPNDANVELFRPIVQYCVSDPILGMLAKSLHLHEKFTLPIDVNETTQANYVRAFVGGYYMIAGHNEAHMLIKQLLFNLLKKSVSEVSRFTIGEKLNLSEISECFNFNVYSPSDEPAILAGTAPELFFRWTLAHYHSIPQYNCTRVDGLNLATVYIDKNIYAESFDSDWNIAVGNAFRNAYQKSGLPSFIKEYYVKKLPYHIESTVTASTSSNSCM
ncbi:26739_t:CDS:2 [Gigaspora margarita]|uniref:26739_t:CDS:1 n=1 Tax=Gigaspora margarita TaxID=4874 RepID=A0ABN7UI68_GIGMA|nr:26739_t:CDS:2 [Gigaspora margarita]